MSQTISAVFVILLSQILPIVGVTIGNDQITAFVQTLVVIVSAVWIYIRRQKTGDLNFSGTRK